MEFDEKLFRPIIERSLLLNELPSDISLTFMNLKRDQPAEEATIKTCAGDIYTIVNMLQDYSRILSLVVEQWELQAYTKARYQYHSERCRKIADKFSASIGYDYDKALEKCRKRAGKVKRDSGVGEEALALALGQVNSNGNEEKSDES